MGRLLCSGCGLVRCDRDFSNNQLNKPSGQERCYSCVASQTRSWVWDSDTRVCSACNFEKSEQLFSNNQLFHKPSGQERCSECVSSGNFAGDDDSYLNHSDEVTETCAACGYQKERCDFSNRQWFKPSGEGRCADCVSTGRFSGDSDSEGTNFETCTACGISKQRFDFSTRQWFKPSGEGRCADCVSRGSFPGDSNNEDTQFETCAACGIGKQRFDFSNRQWVKPSGEGRCADCVSRERFPGSNIEDTYIETCAACGISKQRFDFSNRQWSKPPGEGRCSDCVGNGRFPRSRYNNNDDGRNTSGRPRRAPLSTRTCPDCGISKDCHFFCNDQWMLSPSLDGSCFDCFTHKQQLRMERVVQSSSNKQEERKIEEDRKKEPQQARCCVCLDAEATVTLHPCSHQCLCAACLRSLRTSCAERGTARCCPLCRSPIHRTVTNPSSSSSHENHGHRYRPSTAQGSAQQQQEFFASRSS